MKPLEIRDRIAWLQVDGRWATCHISVRIFPSYPPPFDAHMELVRQLDWMLGKESVHLDALRSLPAMSSLSELDGDWRLYSSASGESARPLPWLDLDCCAVLAIGADHCDDLFVLADLRVDGDDPPVVYNHFMDRHGRCVEWRELSPSLTDFVQRVNLACGIDLSGSSPPRQ